MQNRIVLHFIDGKIMKGFTDNFFPNKNLFHVRDKDNGTATEIDLLKLKGIFFVKSFEGNRNYKERTDTERMGIGKKIQVRFKDGETLIGYTSGYSPERSGFFTFPSDAGSNTERVFVLKNSTEDIRFI
ncbi:MAG: hypothetical protein AABY79_08010 [Nitrospirota bacterium]|jgi:hypothetical protein